MSAQASSETSQTVGISHLRFLFKQLAPSDSPIRGGSVSCLLRLR